MDALTDPAWLAVILAAAAIAVSGFIYWRQRVRKELTSSVSRVRLVSVGSELRGRIKVLLDDRPVGRVDLIRLEIRNTGNAAVRAADFEAPLTLRLTPGAEVLTVDADETDPPEMRPEATVSTDRVEIAPLLLNPRDRFVVKALVSDLAETPLLTGRIAGVSRLNTGGSTAPRRTTARLINAMSPVVLVAVTGGIGALVANLLDTNNTHARISLRTTGTSICGDVFAKNTDAIQIHLTNGTLRRIALDDVSSIRNNAC